MPPSLSSFSSSSEQLAYLASLNQFPPAVLALAPDLVRLRRLKDHLLGLAAKSTGLENCNIPSLTKTVSGTELNKQSWKSLREELGALSLFSSTSFFVIENVEKITIDLARDILDSVGHIPPSTYLVLSAAKLNSSNIFVKHFKANKSFVELDELKGPTLKRWVQKELRQSGGFTQGDSTVPDMLIELGNSSPDKIARSIELLSCFCDSEKVRSEDLHSLFRDKTHANEFQLVDALTRGDQKTMLHEMGKSLNAGKSPLSLLGLISKNLTTILSIKSLKQLKFSDARIKERLGIPDWLYRKYLSNAQHLDLSKAKQACAAVLRADSILKNWSLGDDIVMMELFERLRSR